MTTISIRNTTAIAGKVFVWFEFLNMDGGYKLGHNESFVFPPLTDEECEKETRDSIKDMEKLIEDTIN